MTRMIKVELNWISNNFCLQFINSLSVFLCRSTMCCYLQSGKKQLHSINATTSHCLRFFVCFFYRQRETEREGGSREEKACGWTICHPEGNCFKLSKPQCSMKRTFLYFTGVSTGEANRLLHHYYLASAQLSFFLRSNFFFCSDSADRSVMSVFKNEGKLLFFTYCTSHYQQFESRLEF